MKVFKINLAFCLILASFTVECAENGTKISNLQASSIPVIFGKPLPLKTGQIAGIDPEELRVKLLKVIEDSRCPKPMSCIHEGKVTAVFGIFKKEERNPTIVHLINKAGQPELGQKSLNGYLINLVKITPYPKMGKKINHSDYVATIVIKKH